MPGAYYWHAPREEGGNKRSIIDKGICKILKYLVNGVAILLTMLLSYLAARGKLFCGFAVKKTKDLTIYVANTLFKLAKSMATNVLYNCVGVLKQTVHFMQNELEEVRHGHRAEAANLKAEQDKLRQEYTTLAEQLDECHAENRAVKSQRDCAQGQVGDLNNELGSFEQQVMTLWRECNELRQSIAESDSNRLATKKECERLLGENERLNQRLTGEVNRQKIEEAKRKMENFERQEAEAARRKREEQQKKQRQEEKRRDEEEERKWKVREGAERDKLQQANTKLVEQLDECHAKIRALKAERDYAQGQVDDLSDELGEYKQQVMALQKECNWERERFAAVDSKRLAAKKECDRLLNENERLNQRLFGKASRQRFEEMKRKMEEFERHEAKAARRKREEQQRKQCEEEEKQRQEEMHRQGEEERQRKAQEKAEQETRAREAATAVEEERCRQRDAKYWGKEKWTSDAALKRFHVVTEEFTSTKYSVGRPITLRSIPWPVLDNPSKFTLEGLNWKNVEDFLRHARRFYAGGDSAKYAKLLKDIQLMFHPDKWSSRNLLLTVIDAGLQDDLRQAGKIVSQAVNQWIHETGRSRD